MLRFLDGRISDHQAQRIAAHCCRIVWNHIPDRRWRKMVRTFERFAHGELPQAALEQAQRDMRRPSYRRHEPSPIESAANGVVLFGCHPTPNLREVLARLDEVCSLTSGDVNLVQEYPRGPFLLRCLVNPFPGTFDARYRTCDAIALARAIYEDGAFDRLPLLADALMDAGCDDDLIRSHCRSGGPHVRGCWVVDLVLDKT
jgi:hypothetical protein